MRQPAKDDLVLKVLGDGLASRQVDHRPVCVVRDNLINNGASISTTTPAIPDAYRIVVGQGKHDLDGIRVLLEELECLCLRAHAHEHLDGILAHLGGRVLEEFDQLHKEKSGGAMRLFFFYFFTSARADIAVKCGCDPLVVVLRPTRELPVLRCHRHRPLLLLLLLHCHRRTGPRHWGSTTRRM